MAVPITIKAAVQRRLTHPTVFQDHLLMVLTVSLAVLLLIGWLDYITGFELGFLIFYFTCRHSP